MLRPSEISDLIKTEKYKVVGRLRESNAIELQQRILAGMGRVGVVAKMPATFPVMVELWSLNSEGKLFKHELPALAREGGVCYVGRDKDAKENTRLVLTEEAIEEIASAIGAMKEEKVWAKSWAALEKLRSKSNFFQRLDRGLTISGKGGCTVLQADVQQDDGSVKTNPVGLIVRTTTSDEPAVENYKHNAGFILVIRDTDLLSQLPESQVAAAAEDGEAKTK